MRRDCCQSSDRHPVRPTSGDRPSNIPATWKSLIFAEEMEDRYPDLDPEEAEYVDYMMATGQEPFGGGGGCLLMLIVLITINWLFLGQ